MVGIKRYYKSRGYKGERYQVKIICVFFTNLYEFFTENYIAQYLVKRALFETT